MRNTAEAQYLFVDYESFYAYVSLPQPGAQNMFNKNK